MVVLDAIKHLGHASNACLLDIVRKDLPQVSATTVHRITTRLVEEGLIGTTKIVCSGSVILDSNTQPHQHFRCEECNQLQDVYIDASLLSLVQGQVEDLSQFSSIVINGKCKKCKE